MVLPLALSTQLLSRHSNLGWSTATLPKHSLHDEIYSRLHSFDPDCGLLYIALSTMLLIRLSTAIPIPSNVTAGFCLSSSWTCNPGLLWKQVRSCLQETACFSGRYSTKVADREATRMKRSGFVGINSVVSPIIRPALRFASDHLSSRKASCVLSALCQYRMRVWSLMACVYLLCLLSSVVGRLLAA